MKNNKIYKKTVLKRFYKLYAVDSFSGKEIPITEEIYERFCVRHKFYKYVPNSGNIDFEYDDLIGSIIGENSIDLFKFMKNVYPIFEKHEKEFEKIELEFIDNEGYLSCFEIVGYNLETDEEFEARKRKIEEEKIFKEQEKLLKKEKDKQTRIEKLQKELEKLRK